MLISLLMILALAAEPEAPAAVTPPLSPAVATIQRPNWTRKPSQAALRAAFPKAAVAAGVTGKALIACAVLADGGVGNCSVVSETPEGLGFGEAAVALAPRFRMKLPEGEVIQGWTVRIPVLFTSPPMSLTEVIDCHQALTTGVLGRSEGLGIIRYRDLSKSLLEPKARQEGVSSAELKKRVAESMKRAPNDGAFPLRCMDLEAE